jgi:predicted transcriptional regulator
VKFDNISENFLELSSEQRIRILFAINEKSMTLSKLTEKLGASKSEVHRNLNRMIKAGLIEKTVGGNFVPTIYGKTVLNFVPSLNFIPENSNFFSNHTFGDIPQKFIFRIGVFDSCKHIKGFVKVIEQWKKIHTNSKKYVYNILAEVPYSDDIINTVESKLKSDVLIKSIFATDAVIPDNRNEVFEKKNFAKFVKKEILQRKIADSVTVSLLINEKEACVIFPGDDGKPDMGHAFYGKNSEFHEWCLDYFEYFWNNSHSFQESRLT